MWIAQFLEIVVPGYSGNKQGDERAIFIKVTGCSPEFCSVTNVLLCNFAPE